MILFSVMAGSAWADLESDSCDEVGDDAYDEIGNVFSYGLDYLRMGDVGYSTHLLLLFDSIDIPQGATIDSARVWLYAGWTDASATCNMIIYAEDTASATVYISHADYAARAHTSVSTTWSAVEAWTAGTYYKSPNIASPIQEVIDRGDWSSNNSLGIHIENNSSSSNAKREPRSEQWGTNKPPYILIYYTESGGDTPTRRKRLLGQ
jgi:hypothetical protein